MALVRLSSLGDVVHALPVAHALRVAWPRCELTWVVERREGALLAGHPEIDHVMAVDTRGWRRDALRPGRLPAVFAELRRLAGRLRAGGFEIALDLQGLWKSGTIAWLTRAPVRVGFAALDRREPGSAVFANRRMAVPAGAVHVVQANLALLRTLGLDAAAAAEPTFVLPSDPAAEGTVARWLEEEGVKPGTVLAVLNPGAGGARKRWAIEAYRRLGDELALRLPARIAVCWGPGEEPLARAIAHGMRAAALVPPPTSIPEMVALLRRASLVIGGDTGPIHVAAALGVPTVGLYGPTSAERNGPLGPRTRALQSPTGRIADIGVEAVVRAAEALTR